MTESDKELNFRKLEDSRDAALEDAKSWKSFSAKLLAQVSGYDPDKRVTQMVLEDFLDSDDLNPSEVTADDFTSFATDAGLEPMTVEEEPVQETDSTPTTEEETVISQMQDRADDLETNLSTKEPEGIQEKQIQAQRNGDVRSSVLAGLQMMDEM